MVIRVITPGLTERRVLERVLEALRDPNVSSCVIHKPGAAVNVDGRELVVSRDGEMVSPREAWADGVASC